MADQALPLMILDIREVKKNLDDSAEIMAAGPDGVVTQTPKPAFRQFNFLVLDTLKRKSWTDLQGCDRAMLADLIRVFSDSLLEIRGMHGMHDYANQRIEHLQAAGTQMHFEMQKLIQISKNLAGNEESESSHLPDQPEYNPADLEERGSLRSSQKSEGKKRRLPYSRARGRAQMFGKRWVLPKRNILSAGQQKTKEAAKLREWRAQKRNLADVSINQLKDERENPRAHETQELHLTMGFRSRVQEPQDEVRMVEASSAFMDIETAEQHHEPRPSSTENVPAAKSFDSGRSVSTNNAKTHVKRYTGPSKTTKKQLRPAKGLVSQIKDTEESKPDGRLLLKKLNEFKDDYADKLMASLRGLKKLRVLWLNWENIAEHFQSVIEDGHNYQLSIRPED